MSMAGNLRYAALNQQSVEIGGGIFSPSELAQAAKQIDSAEKLLAQLEIARNRINDMLTGDDGQAWKEAHKALPSIDEAIARAKGDA